MATRAACTRRLSLALYCSSLPSLNVPQRAAFLNLLSKEHEIPFRNLLTYFADSCCLMKLEIRGFRIYADSKSVLRKWSGKGLSIFVMGDKLRSALFFKHCIHSFTAQFGFFMENTRLGPSEVPRAGLPRNAKSLRDLLK